MVEKQSFEVIDPSQILGRLRSKRDMHKYIKEIRKTSLPFQNLCF